MQDKINFYFSKLTKGTFFKNNEDEMIGKVKDVIQRLKENYDNMLERKDEFEEEELEYIGTSTTALIEEIKKKYKNEDDVIGLSVSPMDNFYFLQERSELHEELKEYYDELED